MKPIKGYVDNPKWGDPKKYDILVERIDEEKTSYLVQAEPPIAEPSEEILAAYAAKYVNLDALFEAADPFTH